ncbi:hypothetical protein SCARD494_07521 [Seiridium cardinale]
MWAATCSAIRSCLEQAVVAQAIALHSNDDGTLAQTTVKKPAGIPRTHNGSTSASIPRVTWTSGSLRILRPIKPVPTPRMVSLARRIASHEQHACHIASAQGRKSCLIHRNPNQESRAAFLRREGLKAVKERSNIGLKIALAGRSR